MATFFLYTCITLFIIICLFLILVILIQKGRGGGLASAFGGAGGNTAFGSKTGDVLTWVTSVVFGIFLLLAIALNLLADYHNTRIVGDATGATQQQPVGNGAAAPAPAGQGAPTTQPE